MPGTALITGASTGIGRDLAELFAADKYPLVLVSRNQKSLDELAAQLRTRFGVESHVIALDLAEPGSAEKLFAQIRDRNIEIEFLINNAAFGSHGPFADSEISGQIQMLQLNVVTLTHLTRLFLPEMLARHSGRIMNVASLASFLPGPLMAVYYATKAYVLSFSEALASETSGTGVTVTCLCPGPTKTEFQKRAGVADSLLFRARPMASQTVAQIGYRAMMRGRHTVVAGFANKVLAFSTRLAPRSVAAAITRKLNETR
jgi:uncharacterized protein